MEEKAVSPLTSVSRPSDLDHERLKEQIESPDQRSDESAQMAKERDEDPEYLTGLRLGIVISLQLWFVSS